MPSAPYRLRFRCVEGTGGEQPLVEGLAWNPGPGEGPCVGDFGDERGQGGINEGQFAVECGFGSQSLIGVRAVEELEYQIGIADGPTPEAMTDKPKASLCWLVGGGSVSP